MNMCEQIYLYVYVHMCLCELCLSQRPNNGAVALSETHQARSKIYNGNIFKSLIHPITIICKKKIIIIMIEKKEQKIVIISKNLLKK